MRSNDPLLDADYIGARLHYCKQRGLLEILGQLIHDIILGPIESDV